MYTAYTPNNLPAYAGRTPPAHDLVTSGPLSPEHALCLLADLDHTYPASSRPRAAGLLLDDGRIVVYLWPLHRPDTALALLLTQYGGVRACPERPGGQCWLLDDELPHLLARRIAHVMGGC